MISPGLMFRKLDLHIHTPASQDFGDKSVTADQIVERAIESGLDGIAITDHNSGEWINKVKNAAKGKGVVVFPGVEITCKGGKGGIHLIALFDIDRDSSHVSHFLSTLEILPENQGKNESLASKSLTEIIDIIQNEKWGGIAIPAHVTSSKGILKDMEGQQRIGIIQHPGLIALEATCFQKEQLKKNKKRAVDLLDGTDPNYRRKLAVYQASDNPSGKGKSGHGLDGIGSRCAYFKMEKINLESLRQCFLDPEVRVRQDFEYEQKQYPRIGNVSVSGGFLDGQSISFHKGLNSIIGGKGTGKSLLVEAIRFALDQAPTREDLKQDHDSKLEKRLKSGSYVNVDFIDDTGKTFKLKRTFGNSSSYYENVSYSPSDAFPVLFLSQNEIIKIAENEKEQLKLIDRFFDVRPFRQKIDAIADSIRSLNTQVAASLRSVAKLAELEQRLSTANIELSRFDEKLSHPIFENDRIAETKNDIIGTQIKVADEIQQSIVATRESIGGLGKSALPNAVAEDSTIKENESLINSLKKEVLSELDAIDTKIADSKKLIEARRDSWSSEYRDIRSQYDDYLRSVGGTYQELATQRQQANEMHERLQAELHLARSNKEKLAEILRERGNRLDELEQEYNKYRIEREKRCKYFESNSDGKLKLRIKGETNRDSFREELQKLKRGSFLHAPDIDAIVISSSPRDFIDALLSYHMAMDLSSAEATKCLQKVAEQTSVAVEKIEKLASVLLADDKLEALLELPYKAYPQDSPEIEFGIDDENFMPLDSISVGQKSVALLIMALSDGQMPVVIDQPEDSLDIRSIWEDVCSKVRKNKSQRQFIFTTHNSNVAVASDSDNFIVLEADSERGRIVYNGSMDHNPVADEVLNYMEGGIDSYRRKYTKYRADDRLRRISN